MGVSLSAVVESECSTSNYANLIRERVKDAESLELAQVDTSTEV